MRDTLSYSPDAVSSMISRYSDAYLGARTIDGLGTTVKYVSVGVGALISFASLASITVSMASLPQALGPIRFVAAFGAGAAGIVAACVLAAAGFLLGTLIAAQGQLLKATLDTAANVSRVLSDDDCARIMSLPVHSRSSSRSEQNVSPGQERIPVRVAEQT